jgi:hypothetical protein
MFHKEFSFCDDMSAGDLQDIRHELPPIESQIVEKLFSFCPSAYKNINGPEWTSVRTWTGRVKKELHDLGEKQGYLVLPGKEGGSFRDQWMFDLIWAEAGRDEVNKLDWKKTRHLALACESEWSTDNDEILWDFYKLTFVHADIRLFIYTTLSPKSKRKRPADLCRDACPVSRNFRYLLVGFPENEKGEPKLQIDSWIA